jgi:tRNA U34 5-methylaminomethyl-2-thiouridine-forming methyltransferase MnmC
MKRELRITEDGSPTVYAVDLEEPYHSIHGAIQESEHVFLKQGLHTLAKSPVRLLEIGFGTGLNALLTMADANEMGIEVYYHTVEKYPLEYELYSKINYEQFIDKSFPGWFLKMHKSPWGETLQISPVFTLFKEQSDFRSMTPPGSFDLVYYDAFDPQKQPYLWTEEIFCRVSVLMNPGGVLVSYTSKGSVRRALESCGFHVNKVPGPPGKREMIRAIRS